MDKIKIKIDGRVAEIESAPEVVTDNAEYEVEFAVDERDGWNPAVPMTALFVRRDARYTAVVMDAGETICTMPPQTGTNVVYIGLTQEEMRTTTPARIPIRRSVRTMTEFPPLPDKDVYAQILANFAGLRMLSGKGAPTTETAGKVNQMYRDETNNRIYVCVNDVDGYTWAMIGGGGGGGTVVTIDTTLTKSGQAADAKAAGDAIGKKIDKAQGVENAGMILGVNEDGNVAPEDKPVQALAGATAPTTTTAGVVGQEYYVIVDNAVTEMYVCTSALIGSYTWDKVEFGGNYTLPEATATAIGGIKADDAQTTDTQAVRKGADGKLYTAPGTVTDAQVNTAVSSWLTEHPEATTTVADGSVTPQKTSFLEVKYHNILNWNDADVRDGYFFYTDDDKITGGGGADYCVSGYIPIEAGKTYCFVKVRIVKWLDSAKTYISTSSPSDADIKFTAPENAAFARIDTNSAKKDISYIYEYTGEEYDYSAYATEYEIFPGDPKYSDMITRSIVSSMNDGSVNVPDLIPENTLDYKQIKGTDEFHWNIINPEKCRFGIEISETTGAEENRAPGNIYFYTSDYTAVEPNEILIGWNYRVIGYDSDKQFVSKITWNNGKFIIPDNVKFIRARETGNATAQDSAKIVLLRNKYGKSFAYTDNYSYDNMFPMFSNEDCLNGYKGYLGVRRRSNDKICVIGDSFTAPSTWVNLMCEKLGAYKIANHAVSGGSFSDHDGVPKTAYEQAQEMVANSEMPDVILVTLGTNDCNNNRTIGDISYSNDISTFDLTTFTGGLQACINYLANNYPTAKIYVGWTPMGGLYSTSNDPTPYIARMQTVCMAYGVQYIETRTCGVSPLVTAHADCFEGGVNGGHPTDSGQQRIGEYMTRLMECMP